ncbi:type IV pilus modification PilV family protein [Chrysiogenes arsenatis]|uniref:type IV pilus modification PilV family protein n=1 Tax=Chrysiogenes arsenatis TaxID=309797 RepID=UPI0003FDC134|nr:prepilin-type N-terminal cleavage/methylation domain-containing protein [Chrysiogenes arsenatis]
MNVHNQSGFSLIEAIVALALAGMGAAILTSYLFTAVNLEQAYRDTLQASSIAQERLAADRNNQPLNAPLPDGFTFEKKVLSNAMPFADLHSYEVTVPGGRKVILNDYRQQ